MPNSTPLLLNLCINDADVRRLSGGAMGDRGSVRYSRSSLAEPSPLVQTQPALTKRAQTHFPKWVLQLAHKINLKFCVAWNRSPLLVALTKKTANPSIVLQELLKRASGRAPSDLSILDDLSDLQLYRLYKSLKSYGALFDALEGYSKELLKDPELDGEQQRLFETLKSMGTDLGEIWIEVKKRLDDCGIQVKGERLPAIPEAIAQIRQILEITFEDLRDPTVDAVGRLMLNLQWVRTPPSADKAKRIEDFKQFTLDLITKGVINRTVLINYLEQALFAAGEKVVEFDPIFDALENVCQSERIRLVEPLLSALRLQDDGAVFRQDLYKALADIQDAGKAALPPRSFEDLWTVENAQQAANAIHDVSRQIGEGLDEQAFKAAVKDRLASPSSGFTAEGAQNFLNSSNRSQLFLRGYSRFLREAIDEYANDLSAR